MQPDLLECLFGITLLRLPEMLIEIDDFIVADFYTLVFEQLLHEVGAVKVEFPGQQPGAIHDTVCRDVVLAMRRVHCPANHPGRPWRGQHLCNCAVRGYFAVRDPAYDFIDLFEKIVV